MSSMGSGTDQGASDRGRGHRLHFPTRLAVTPSQPRLCLLQGCPPGPVQPPPPRLCQASVCSGCFTTWEVEPAGWWLVEPPPPLPTVSLPAPLAAGLGHGCSVEGVGSCVPGAPLCCAHRPRTGGRHPSVGGALAKALSCYSLCSHPPGMCSAGAELKPCCLPSSPSESSSPSLLASGTSPLPPAELNSGSWDWPQTPKPA